MKRLLIVLALLLVLTGCEANGYINYGDGRSMEKSFKLDPGYILSDNHPYDRVETEQGYDLVFHFVKEERP